MLIAIHVTMVHIAEKHNYFSFRSQNSEIRVGNSDMNAIGTTSQTSNALCMKQPGTGGHWVYNWVYITVDLLFTDDTQTTTRRINTGPVVAIVCMSWKWLFLLFEKKQKDPRCWLLGDKIYLNYLHCSFETFPTSAVRLRIIKINMAKKKLKRRKTWALSRLHEEERNEPGGGSDTGI